jgi:hypothetical protein
MWWKLAPLQFSKKLDHIRGIMPTYYKYMSFLDTLTHLNDFMSNFITYDLFKKGCVM